MVKRSRGKGYTGHQAADQRDPDANAIQNLADNTAIKSVKQVNQNLEAATQNINQGCATSFENLKSWVLDELNPNKFAHGRKEHDNGPADT